MSKIISMLKNIKNLIYQTLFYNISSDYVIFQSITELNNKIDNLDKKISLLLSQNKIQLLNNGSVQDIGNISGNEERGHKEDIQEIS